MAKRGRRGEQAAAEGKKKSDKPVATAADFEEEDDSGEDDLPVIPDSSEDEEGEEEGGQGANTGELSDDDGDDEEEDDSDNEVEDSEDEDEEEDDDDSGDDDLEEDLRETRRVVRAAVSDEEQEEEGEDEDNSEDSDADGEVIEFEAEQVGERGATRAEPRLLNGDIGEDPGSDSSEDERPNRNTVGNVPLHWYKDEDHIGYALDGKPIIKKPRADMLQRLLDRNDSRKALRTIYDEYNDEEIELSKEELEVLVRIRNGQFPDVNINPFEPYNDYFTREQEMHPIVDHPVPKRRFIPSKHEEKKIVQLVRAIRKGWIKTSDQRKKEKEEPKPYLLWAEDNVASAGKSASGLTYIPAAKPKLPAHEESYNPSKEYLYTEEEKAAFSMLHEEDRPKFIPAAYNSLREVPQYPRFVHELFERCLDLYLAPRVHRKRMFIDPESLVPKLPKPADLQPFPTTLAIRYKGHTGKVNSISVHPSGQWLLSGSADSTMRCWEVSTGRCTQTWQLNAPVHRVCWCPNATFSIASAAVERSVVLVAAPVGNEEQEAATARALQLDADLATDLATWQPRKDGGIIVTHKFPVKHVCWHGRGDYFATVAPTGNTKAVLVHQLSKRATQNPFKKARGRIPCVLFHPNKPFFFVATQNHVLVYNLAKQALAKKLIGGSGTITSLSVHPSGDHVLVGSDDKRVAWYDLDLSTKPYKAMRYHKAAVRGTAFHSSYPLFATAADDGTTQVFHGMVYSDLLTNPLIVPVKILRGHQITDHSGVLDCAFHPNQPWVFSAGGDADICLHVN